MNSEQNQKEVFKKMMEESFKQDELYTAGNYWKYYEKVRYHFLNQLNFFTLIFQHQFLYTFFRRNFV